MPPKKLVKLDPGKKQQRISALFLSTKVSGNDADFDKPLTNEPSTSHEMPTSVPDHADSDRADSSEQAPSERSASTPGSPLASASNEKPTKKERCFVPRWLSTYIKYIFL